MNNKEFREYGHKIVDWIADYMENVTDYPVKSQLKPGDVLNKLPNLPPEDFQPMEAIMEDFKKIILPGITHWQHPKFFAYFNANNSYPSILAEMLTAALGAQCMIWETSPAAAELEERMMEWLRQMIGLPEDFTGVIQDTASTSTLCSLLTARERITKYAVNTAGLSGQGKFITYCSTEAHSSVEKAVKIAGLGKDSLRKIRVDDDFAMRPDALKQQIEDDISQGHHPMAVVSAIGTTSSTAIDPLRKIGEICRQYNLFHHVDAAHAGTALILPEMRWMIDGIEYVDSFVFNPHKWMFTNFDCSAYFVRNEELLIKTFEILPEYLKTKTQKVKNYRDWGIQLGRRFRALKLWFVIRDFGVKGLQEKIRSHLLLAQWLYQQIENDPKFESLAPAPLNTVCFRFHPPDKEESQLNDLNERLLHQINQTGKMFFTHTKLNGIYTLRMVIGQTHVNEQHVKDAWEWIKAKADEV